VYKTSEIYAANQPQIWTGKDKVLKKILTRIWVGWLGFNSFQGLGIFLSLCPDQLWGLPNLLSNGYWGLKQPGCEADHLPPSSADVKNVWCYTSTPPVCLHSMVLSYAQGQLNLYLYWNAFISASCHYMLYSFLRKEAQALNKQVTLKNLRNLWIPIKVFTFNFTFPAVV
jgi:hypothetical protein